MTECLAPMRVTCNEDDFSENSRCILEGWLTYIDLKHAIPFADCSRFSMAGMPDVRSAVTFIIRGDC